MEPIGDGEQPEHERREGRQRDAREDDRPRDRRAGHTRKEQLPILRHAPEQHDRRPVERETEHATELSSDERKHDTDG